MVSLTVGPVSKVLPVSQPDLVQRTASEQGAAHQIAGLADQLRLKDELVSQLTERLEQTVEQLDRLHRTGADRRSGGGGDPSQFSAKLDEALQNWGQTTEQYDAIIERLDGMYDILEKGGGPATGGHSASQSRSSTSSSTPARSSAPAPAAAPATGSYWDKLKAGMMDGAGAPAPTASAPASASAPAHQRPVLNPSTDDTASSTESTESPTLLVLGDLPTPVVFVIEAADIEQLRAAVTERDQYIVALISQFRTIESLPALPPDLEKAGLAPEELIRSLTELEARLKAKIQREELELSIERAKMARERAKLDLIKGQLEGQIRRLASGVAVEPPTEKKPQETDKKMGWLKRLRGTPNPE